MRHLYRDVKTVGNASTSRVSTGRVTGRRTSETEPRLQAPAKTLATIKQFVGSNNH